MTSRPSRSLLRLATLVTSLSAGPACATDFHVWEPIGVGLCGADGVLVLPDPASVSAAWGFYRAE